MDAGPSRGIKNMFKSKINIAAEDGSITAHADSECPLP